MDLRAAAWPAALRIEARRDSLRHDDLRLRLAPKLFQLVPGALDGDGGAGGELLDRVGKRRGVDLEDQGQQAGRRAIERSAHVEALGHLNQGMTLLQTPPTCRRPGHCWRRWGERGRYRPGRQRVVRGQSRVCSPSGHTL